MKVFKFSFTGRKNNAIGKTYKINKVVEAENETEAFKKLYDDHEHITNINLEWVGEAGVTEYVLSTDQPKQYAPLREIMVYYKNGGKDNAPFCTAVNMAAHLTDKEMLDYFAPGAVFNVGAGEFDCMAEVERAEIIL